MSTCMRFFVSGRVQGVFFRASTQSLASKLGLVGYARNLPDRRVEVLACGEEACLRELESWLSMCPQHAEVTELVSDLVTLDQPPVSFDIG